MLTEPVCPAPVVGAKARRLLDLQQAGLPVPTLRCWPDDLPRIIQDLGFPLAVRSSAETEDGQGCSFAGQFRSFLNLRTMDEVRRAIDACLASATTPSVAEYCRRHGIDFANLRMGVFVQRMVEPELAGVAFTINPLTGEEEVVIEACVGLADELLQGHQAALSNDHPLLQQYRPEIERLSKAAQQILGTPQDIEFAVAAGQVFLLQARPVTRIAFQAEVGEWTNADFRDGGVSCGVCTPLMWSLYEFIWGTTLKEFLGEIRLFQEDFVAGRMFFGRPYWNLGAVKDCLAQLPGFVERDFDRDLGVEPQYEGQGRVTPITLRGVIRALPTLWSIPKTWKRQERFNRAFLQGEFQDQYDSSACSPFNAQTLHDLVHGLYRTTESNYFKTIFCASLAKLDFMEAFPHADYAALVSGLPSLAHLDPVAFLRQNKGQSQPEEFIRRFPHRSRRELDIRAPRWDEDPDWVERLMRETDAPTTLADPKKEYAQARTAALSQFRPWQRGRFERKLDRLRNFVWMREQMRDLSTRVYHLLRRCLLVIARERNLGDDIFFMRWQSILADDRSEVTIGRHTYEGFRHFRAPNEIGARYPFEPRTWDQALRGLAASPGRVSAVARVARTVEEAAEVESGCVLVCPFTDPGWTPLLNRVAGVVTETGGLLSHAAVICREFGIPAVLNLPDATRRIRDRARVTVDGGLGYVELER